MTIYFWEFTWICELKSRHNIVKPKLIIKTRRATDIFHQRQCQRKQQHNNTITNYKSGDHSLDSSNSIDKVLIERQSHLCHSKKIYCVLLYYDPALYCALLLLFKTFKFGNASNEKPFNSTVLMPTITELIYKTDCKKTNKINNNNNNNKSFQQFWLIEQFLEIPILSQSSKSHRRRRRRHLNSFCDNFKTI